MIQKILTSLCKIKTLFYILLIVNMCLVAYYINEKQGFHSDEQWSYAHANSSKGAYLDEDIDSYYMVNDNIRERLFNHWIPNTIIHDYLTVQADEKFSYKNIYQNLRVVEHPPLYFIILHTICSFFPDSFSKWYAGTLNIVIFLLLYIVLYKLSQRLLNDERLALCTVALWGFSLAGINTAVFLRMYILQTLFYVALCYEVIKVIQTNKITKCDLSLICLYSFLGIYNQYNALFFSFFVTICGCFVFLKRKNIKLMFAFAGVMLLSVMIFFIIYPPAADVLFNSLRAQQILSSFKQINISSNKTFMDILYGIDIRMSYLIAMITEQFFAFTSTNYKAVIFCILMLLVISFYIPQKMKTETKWLSATVILYMIYLLSMPYMHLFHSRYYMGIMPFIAIFTIMIAVYFLEALKVSKNRIIGILSILVLLNTISSNFLERSPYAFKWNQDERNIYKKIEGRQVFIDNGQNFIWLHSMLYYLANAEKIYITENICDEQPMTEIIDTENPIIFTYASYIPKQKNYNPTSCLQNISFKLITTVCASQHCYDVWEK